MASRRLVITAEEDLDAPRHRRWRGTVRYPDGAEHETFAETHEQFIEAVFEQDWIVTVCAHPECDEPCTGRDYCPGCGHHVCWHHSKDVARGHRELEDHWLDEG